MKISKVDQAGRLFLIQDLVAPDLLHDIMSLDWRSLPTLPPAPQQKNWLRREINLSAYSIQMRLTEAIYQLTDQIQEYCGVEWDFIGVPMWWIDYPEFKVPVHTDGHLPSALQMFWAGPGKQYGTVFYDCYQNVLKQFDFTANTGYLMLNQLNSDGSQPLLWHGMQHTVPLDQIRVTTYHVFGQYSHK